MRKRTDGLQPPQTSAEAVNYFLVHVPLAVTDGYEQLEIPDAEHWKFRTLNSFEWLVGTDGSVVMLDAEPAPLGCSGRPLTERKIT